MRVGRGCPLGRRGDPQTAHPVHSLITERVFLYLAKLRDDLDSHTASRNHRTSSNLWGYISHQYTMRDQNHIVSLADLSRSSSVYGLVIRSHKSSGFSYLKENWIKSHRGNSLSAVPTQCLVLIVFLFKFLLYLFYRSHFSCFANAARQLLRD